MSQKTFTQIAGAIFPIVAILHGLRLLFGWHVSLGGWIAPMWVSWAGLALAGYLAYTALVALKK